METDLKEISPPAPKDIYQKYIAFKAPSPIEIDGNIHKDVWENTSFTNEFVDIEGREYKPDPLQSTRVKMLWDEDYFYIAATLLETDVWAYETKKNSVIFHENDFEVFIDVNGSNHNYYEFEINALNTIWELLLVKPYRDQGPALYPRNIDGLVTAVRVNGTINNSSEIDLGWDVEMKIPLKGLATYIMLDELTIKDGDHWRINFSRVQWNTSVNSSSGRYVKKPGPEYNWVWSPQDVINMHCPELYGFVQFSDIITGSKDCFDVIPHSYENEIFVKEVLMKIYYAQTAYKRKYSKFTNGIKELLELGKYHLSKIAPIHMQQLTVEITKDPRLLSGIIIKTNDDASDFTATAAIKGDHGDTSKCGLQTWKVHSNSLIARIDA